MLGYAFPNPNLGEGLCIFTSFHFPDAGLKLLNGSDFHFDLFKWCDTENQQQGMWWHVVHLHAAPKRTGSGPVIVTVISLW